MMLQNIWKPSRKFLISLRSLRATRGFNRSEVFRPSGTRCPVCGGVFGVSTSFRGPDYLIYGVSLARANSETKSMAIHIPRRLRGDLVRGGRSFREPRLSPKGGYYAIYGLSGRASATLPHAFHESDLTAAISICRAL